MNKFYVCVSSLGKCGCRFDSIRIWETEKNKTQIRKSYVGTGKRVEFIYNDKDLQKLPQKCVEYIMSRAY